MKPVRRPLGDGTFLLEYDSVSSTQDAARALHKCGETTIIGVRTNFQELGRGRFGRRWTAAPGSSLLITYLVPLTAVHRAPLIGMAAALAVADSIEGVTCLPASVKWPNDVLILGRKVAGILVETCLDSDGASIALTGVGINLSVDAVPPGMDHQATSLEAEGRNAVGPVEFEEFLRPRLFDLARNAQDFGFELIRCRWNNRDVSGGQSYRAPGGDGMESGVAKGISASGALILMLKNGEVMESIHATASEE